MPWTRVTHALQRTALLGALLIAGPLEIAEVAAASDAVPVAVIVHRQVPVDGLSLPELRRIFLGERLFWTRDLTITLLVPPRGSPERKVLLDKIYQQRSEAHYQHHWINKLFGGGAMSTPKSTGSPTSLVREIPGAIALVSVDKIPKGVKVIRIDGKQPGEVGYPLAPPG